MSAKTRTLLALGVVAVAVAALLVPRLREARGEDVTPAEDSEPLEVEVRRLAPGRLVERLATVGTLLPDERVVLRSEIAGVLESIHFDEGSRVRRGDLLARLDDAELAAERDRAHHRVELASRREARQKDLLEQGLTSQEEYDLALSQLEVLQAELRLAQAQLDKTELRAPFDGRVGLRSVSEGATVDRDTPIASLQRLDPIKVEFSVPESYASRLRPGTRVRFRVKGSDRDHEATVYAAEPAVDPETRSLAVRARAPNPHDELLPGAFADVELAVREVEDALTVPALAVIPELGGKKVFVLEEGRAQARRVETGVRSETEVQITAGLEPGEKVIVSAIQRLASGLPVRERPAS
ncbi:MAG: efflux RND transporter periplasmic adaptor subunit [Thermoanaerobaculia bacterium]|nr:efflux RND transporter periplasmic adaptor subunit [Thermoanaerobaculia bacterium]